MCKRCASCEVEKPLAEFYEYSPARRATHHPKCKVCVRDEAFQRRYGICLAEYNQMLAEQEGACAICGEHCSTGRELAVDHDHVTGRVRGLLCSNCNLGLGKFRDKPYLLVRAAEYLEKK